MKDQTASTHNSPWLDYEGAAARLRAQYNVDFKARTIQNKVSAGEIPSHLIAGQRRINQDELDAWALGEWEPAPAEATS